MIYLYELTSNDQLKIGLMFSSPKAAQGPPKMIQKHPNVIYDKQY